MSAEEKAVLVSNNKTGLSVYGGARKGAKQWQEDSYFYGASANGVVVVAAIYDGHGGYNGLIASGVARQCTQQFLAKYSQECESWEVAEWERQLSQLFEHIHERIRERFLQERGEDSFDTNGRRHLDDKRIVRNSSGDPVHGGSTGSLVVLKRMNDGSCVSICANVGDSTSLYLPRDSTTKLDFLTVDHGPENNDEFARLKALDESEYPTKLMFVYDKANVFRKYECPRVFLDDGRKDPVLVQNPWGNGLHPTNVRYEPAVYAVTPRCISRDTTCIAMTRALGDFYAQQFGLTHIPSVRVRKYTATEEFVVVVASDGVWDCWKYEDFKAYVHEQINKRHQLDMVVEQSLNESIQRAITNFGTKHYDDASMILIHALPKSQ